MLHEFLWICPLLNGRTFYWDFIACDILVILVFFWSMTNSCCFQDFSEISSLITSISESILCTELKMYMVESKGGAIVCMLLALFFLGTWPAVLTLLERRGRLPQHTYLDYSITNLLAALIIALTFGEIGKSTPDEPNFLVQLAQVRIFFVFSTCYHHRKIRKDTLSRHVRVM